MQTSSVVAESVVNHSLPAFHFCNKSIGLCRTQHLIAAHKVTDYWIVTYCIEGCLWLHCNCFAKVANENSSAAALSITFVLNYGLFVATKLYCGIFLYFYFALFWHFLLSDKFKHTEISYLYLTFLLNTLSVCRRPCHCRALLKAC